MKTALAGWTLPAGATTNAPIESPDRAARRAEVVTALARVLPPDAILSRREDTVPYECDGLTAYRATPLVVVLPTTEAQVAAVEAGRLEPDAGGALLQEPVDQLGDGQRVEGGRVGPQERRIQHEPGEGRVDDVAFTLVGPRGLDDGGQPASSAVDPGWRVDAHTPPVRVPLPPFLRARHAPEPTGSPLTVTASVTRP